MTTTYDWDVLIPQAKELAAGCTGPVELAERLNVPRSTLRSALRRLSVKLEYNTATTNVVLGLQAEESLNELHLTYTDEISEHLPDSCITTVDQLLELAEVDMSIWFVERFKLNKYPMGAKAEYQDLRWDGGVMSGWSKKNGLQVVQLIQVTVWLARREPIARFPTIRPIQCIVTTPMPLHTTKRGTYRRDLLCGDPHFWFHRNVRSGQLTPFHDRRALDLVTQIAILAEVDNIRVIGDILDMTDCTDRFLKSPEVMNCFQPAILEAHWHLRRWREIAKVLVHQGNHDKRLEKAILMHLCAAYELRAATRLHLPPALSIQYLLCLDELDITWIDDYPEDIAWLNDDIQVCHGPLSRMPGDTAKAMVRSREHNVFFAHIHRVEMATGVSYTRHERRERIACSVGTLCHVDGRVPGVKRNQEWNQACILVDYDEDDTPFNYTVIPFDNGVAMYDRQVLEARPILPTLREAYPEWNWAA